MSSSIYDEDSPGVRELLAYWDITCLAYYLKPQPAIGSLIVKEHPGRPRGCSLSKCKICGKRGTRAVVAAHIVKYHPGEHGVGMPTK